MQGLVLGSIAVVIGLLLCFAGYLAMRVLISIFGAFFGFLLGAGVVATVTNGGLLATTLSWVVGIVVAIAFGLLAYFFYQVSVVLGMATIGFTIGATITAALSAGPGWVTVLVGSIVAVILAVLAIVTNLPVIILIVTTALAGASTAVTGVALLLGAAGVPGVGGGVATRAEWWWFAAYVVLAVVGIVAQGRHYRRRRRTARQQWDGRPDRAAPAAA